MGRGWQDAVPDGRHRDLSDQNAGRETVSAHDKAAMTATHARYRVVALATSLAMVTYLDRVAIGTLAPAISRDLGLTTIDMGWVFFAFQLAYGLFEVPTGRWADRVGPRSVLARIVIWWSALTT